MNIDELLKRIIRLTPEEEKELRTQLKAGKDWTDYYKGEYTVIRNDKLALLMKDQKTLRSIRQERDVEPPKYCRECGSKIKTMPCDEELVYCPTCDLDHAF